MGQPAWLWANSAGSPNNDYAKFEYGSSSIATDQLGHSYVTGSFNGPMTFPGGLTLASSSYPKVFVAKFDAAGMCLWANEFGGDDTDTYGNQGESIDIDLQGDCYVVGTFHGSSGSTVNLAPGVSLSGTGSRQIFIVRYNANGTVVWARQPSTNQNTNHYAKSVTSNDAGDSYTTGYLGGSGGSFGLSGPGAYVVKHAKNGSFSWATKVGNGGVDGHCVTLDAADDCYVTGYFQGMETFNTASGNVTLTSIGFRDIFLAKVTSSGVLSWVKQYGVSGATSVGNGVSSDTSGHIYLTGDRSFNNSGITEAVVLKVDTNGTIIWSRQSGAPALGNAIKVSPCGGCYVAGTYSGQASVQFGLPLASNSTRRAYVLHFDANGNSRWTQTSGSTNTGEAPLGIGVDASSYIYIAGHAQGAAEFGQNTLGVYGGLDAFVAKLDRGCDEGCQTTDCAAIAAEVDDTLWDAASNHHESMRPCDYRDPAPRPGPRKKWHHPKDPANCDPLDFDRPEPSVFITHSDSKCDCLESDDVEVMNITVCNRYSNITLTDLTIQSIEVVGPNGGPPAPLPDGSPSVVVAPIGPFCFGDIEPCSCVSRQFVMRLRGAVAGTYRVKVTAMCFAWQVCESQQRCFEFEVCAD